MFGNVLLSGLKMMGGWADESLFTSDDTAKEVAMAEKIKDDHTTKMREMKLQKSYQAGPFSEQKAVAQTGAPGRPYQAQQSASEEAASIYDVTRAAKKKAGLE
tara:strand:+ start:1130 stop:1438 length:309 start_codon:yes stop_codon:yes gene_type:complete